MSDSLPMLTLADAQRLLNGSAAPTAARSVGDAATAFTRVHTDTRTLQPGDLFVALRGEHFDGHDHLGAARDAGAAALLVEHGAEHAVEAAGLPGLLVGDTLLALQQLAAAWRARMHLPLIAVTGSNGKTTVTQMVASILRAWHPDGTLATAGNLNNHIGVPLTLLRLRQDNRRWHCAAVLELGMNHVGEIARLAALAAPTVALVNNAQREHLEFMHSVDAVARENGSVISALSPGGTAVLPAGDAYAPLWRELAGARDVLAFGCSVEGELDSSSATAVDGVHGHAQWQADRQRWLLNLHSPFGSTQTLLGLPGRHNLHNAVAAAAAALAAGATLDAVQRGLAAFSPVAGRSQTLALRWQGRAVTLVDDSYNANPDSVLAAIDMLGAMPGPRWLVLGDMGEVGSEGPRFHAEAGAAARRAGIEQVWSAGTLSAQVGADRHFGSVAQLLSALPDSAPACASVLVKGSRFMQMEQVVEALQGAAADPLQAAAGAAHAA